jgi:signal transduction histidine kinase
MKFFRGLRSLMVRMIVSHIAVAVLTSVSAVLILALVVATVLQNLSVEDYHDLGAVAVAEWQLGVPDGQPNVSDLPPGFSVIVGPDKLVIYSYGDTTCRATQRLADCAPELLDSMPGQRFVQVKGERRAEIVTNLVGGQRVISRYGHPSGELSLILGNFNVSGTLPFALMVAVAVTVLAIPLALLLGWLWARPLAKRLSRIRQASYQFAAGDLQVRVRDQHKDEVGELAQQFDEMSNNLEQNLFVLRELAQRNVELTQQAELAAIQTERVRLSRDLHDDIAQQLFSLSVGAAVLPDLIERDQLQSVAQAKAIASLAEKTLLDLRDLLVELRPSSVLQRGLTEALQELCEQWQTSHHIKLNYSFMLTGQYIPAAIEDIIYRVMQEALHNIVKHAAASNVEVSLVEGRNQLTLSVTDDGKGFDPNQTSTQSKFGLLSMRERAQMVGGKLVVESDTARGTTIRMTLPLQRENGALPE